MLAFITHDTRAEHRRLLVAGLAFMTAIAILIGLSIAVYNKSFDTVTTVTIKAGRAGQQLAKYGDVRVHGVLVGQVREISQDGKNASIKVALRPAQAKRIPENVRVQILPTTLFGQKYISFVVPSHASAKSLSNGDVIPASRVSTNVELQTILAHLFPLLRSIRPQDLNATLYAISTALQGRGEKIGEAIEKLDDYLTVTNQHLPALRADIALLARVSQAYAIAAPDLIRLLRNSITTAHTVTAERASIDTLMSEVTTVSATGTRLLSRNGDAIVKEMSLARPLVGLLARYAPEYPCLLEGADRYQGRLNEIFKNHRVNQTMDLNAKQNRVYTGADRPWYGDIGHGPWCLDLPNSPKKVPYPSEPLKNGTMLDGGD